MSVLAERVRAALDGADLDAMRELLAPNARWGPGEDPGAGCQNRNEVLQWWQQGRDRGRRGRVAEIVAAPGKLLVGLKVSEAAGGVAPVGEGEIDRWQVLTIDGGKVVDIRGFDDRQAAAASAGVTD